MVHVRAAAAIALVPRLQALYFLGAAAARIVWVVARERELVGAQQLVQLCAPAAAHGDAGARRWRHQVRRHAARDVELDLDRPA